MPRTPTVVFILASGHSGSTLLDLILGSHTDGFSLGELSHLRFHRGDQVCGICTGECSFWDQRIDRRQVARYFGWQRRPSRIGKSLDARLGGLRGNIYNLVQQASGSHLLIDSSKGLWWIRRQLRPRWQWRRTRPFLLYLFRDGRAVANSMLRKYPNSDFQQLVQGWVAHTREREQYFEAFSQADRMKITYGQLTADPQATIASICERLHVDFQPEMLEYWKRDHHLVMGNRGTRELIFMHRQQFGDAAVRSWSSDHARYYHQIGLAIRQDTRWRDELSTEHAAQFEQLAGPLNRACGGEPDTVHEAVGTS